MERSGVFVGAATLDLRYLVAGDRPRDSKGPASRFGVSAGGPAANAAITFAHLGGRARLYSEVGSHPLAGMIADDLAAHRVEVVDLAPHSTALPMISSIVSFESTGERMAVSSRYADDGDAPGLHPPLPPDTEVVLVDGFLHAAAHDAAARADAAGIPVVLDGGSWKPGLADLLPFVDVAVCSADFRPPGIRTVDESLAYLQERGVFRVAATRGSRPILYRDGDDHGEIPVPEVEVVDTLGAGDVFHGALCWAIAGGRSFPDALTEAAIVATRSCTGFGTRAWMGR